MNNLMGFIILNLAAATAQATCVATPLAFVDGKKFIDAEITQGSECRGITSHADYTADHYSFQGKTGDTFSASMYTSDLCSPYYGQCGEFAYWVLLDPQGIQIGNLHWTSSNFYISYSTTLMTSGLYKLIVTGNTAATIAGTHYAFEVSLSSPTSQSLYCPADTYNKGKLSIQSVEVPNGLGGVIKYQANLSLLPFSNPTSFILNSAQPLE